MGSVQGLKILIYAKKPFGILESIQMPWGYSKW